MIQTREGCRKLQGTGLLPERWELVQGAIISKVGTSLPHSMIAKRMDTWLSAIFPTDRILPTCSIDVAPEDNPTSEPEPDITIINQPASQLGRNPVPSDILLVVEISDTSIGHDLGAKARLYGRAGIPEYWVIDINAGRIHQHRKPNAEGYGSVRVVEGSESLSPLARKDAALTPGSILG